ncbi:sulfotransferase [uncultured Sphingomonas sp.]|jgi:tetratricopeptide (TPR) repeat protein|uniref:sulfotransferase family protein n=1 Tax=uncultured Sphingomonas sp. TaxID=158754 RepID=UPI0030DACB12
MTAPATIDSLRHALHAGQPAAAARDAERLLADSPDDIDLLEIAAIAAEAGGDRARAERRLRHLVAIAPDALWARDDLAHFLLRHGRADEAEAVARDAIALAPDAPAAHAFIGQRMIQREALVEGAWHLRTARRHLPAAEAAQLAPALGRALLRLGEPQEAAALAREALAAAPASLDAATLATEAAEQSGDAAAAEAAFAHAERIAAATGRDVALLGARVLAIGARWREALARLDRLPDDAGGAALLLRGRLRDRAGRHEAAWRDIVAGKARLARPYDRDVVERRFAQQRAWPAALPAAPRRPDVAQPVFIMGMPRSGTTLLEQIVSAHPDIRAGGELPFVAELRAFAHGLLGTDVPLPVAVARLRIADRHHLPALFRDFYLARARQYGLDGGARLFTDKMPLNEVDAPLIRLAFPDAPLLLMRRHPLDTLVSVMAHDMTHGANCAYRLEDAAHHLAGVSDVVADYRNRLGIAPLIVRYEDLVTDPETQVARVMAAIGLPPHPAQRDFHRQSRHAPTPSHAQVREPLHARAVERWRPYAAALAPIVPVVAAALERGGYTA